MRQVNFGSGFFRSSDAPWSERSWIGLLSKETQLRFRILSDLRIQSWIFWKKRALSVSHSPHSLSLHYFTEHFRLIKSTGWDVYLHNYSIFWTKLASPVVAGPLAEEVTRGATTESFQVSLSKWDPSSCHVKISLSLTSKITSRLRRTARKGRKSGAAL